MNKNDVVYRDQIIDTLKKNMPYAIFDDDGNYTTRGMRLLDVISAVPTVPTIELQPKKGKWMEMSDELQTWLGCSECHWQQYEKSNFCPNCGARMDGESDG